MEDGWRINSAKMKYSLIVILFLSNTAILAQKHRTPIQTVRSIFRDYIQQDESTESRDNKQAMEKALIAIQRACRNKDLPLLINVWMYYDPTDFPTRDLIDPIFQKHKPDALNAVRTRIRHKRSTEERGWAPYEDLFDLEKKLLQ